MANVACDGAIIRHKRGGRMLAEHVLQIAGKVRRGWPRMHARALASGING